MKYCQICYTNFSFVSPCNCQICIPCLIKWFGVKNEYSQVHNFQCPIEKCTYIYTRQELQNICKYPQYQLQLSEILLKEYLKYQDIRPCANSKCKNFGFIDLNYRCDSHLQCTSCNFKWKDVSIATYGLQLDYGISNMYFNIKDFIYCFINTNECPQCGVQIQKNGGCKHMTCKACKFQFCWQCKKQWQGHKGDECTKHLFLITGIITAMIIALIDTFGLLSFALFIMSIPFSWTFVICTANVIPFGFVVGIVYFCYGLKHLYNKTYKQGIIEVSISTISLIIWYCIHQYIVYYFDYSMSMYISIILWEGIIAIIIVCYLFRKQLTWIVVPISTCCIVYFFGLDGLYFLTDALPYIKKQFFPYKLYFYIGGYLIFILLNLINLNENVIILLSFKILISIGHLIIHISKNQKKQVSILNHSSL